MYSCFRVLTILLGVSLPWASVFAQNQATDGRLFNTREERKEGFTIFPQWVSVMRRQADEHASSENCPANLCKMPDWQQMISSIRGRSVRDQLLTVNDFANRFRYVQDQDNYGRSDYWAIPREFLSFGGDCEDYAIIKYFSLRQLGVPAESLRIVVVQDANLRIPHAILAVYTRDDILILDNQVPEIVSHRKVAHYVPVFSLNERNWWMHLP
ncbi:transglutaminase-like cysteine peptidase [Ferribacterium limneticum]|nr:transglutaminase-like cysteine peptidase [Ferribacterium limneticum]UCV31060.1 transglutaminase-like cysteine peptidase [Ferribacterium limneticum]